MLPSVGAVLGLQLRGGVRAGDRLLSAAGVTGVQATARDYGYLAGTLSVLVRFTAQGAACLGVPGSLLADQSVAIEDVLPALRARELRERFVNAPGVPEAVDVVQELLLTLPYVHDPLEARARSRCSRQPMAARRGWRRWRVSLGSANASSSGAF